MQLRFLFTLMPPIRVGFIIGHCIIPAGIQFGRSLNSRFRENDENGMQPCKNKFSRN